MKAISLKAQASFGRLIKNKGLVFALFLILGLVSQIFVLIAPDLEMINWFSSDDAYYYFKTAQNIAEGKGITFDGFYPTNGFHPLWMAVCVPVFVLARFNLFIPLRIIILILIVLNAGTGYFIYRLFEKKSDWAGLFPAFFWMFFIPIHERTTQLGLETGLTAFMLAFFLFQNMKIKWNDPHKKIKSQLALTGLVGLGLLLSRLDSIFILVTIGVWNIFYGEKFNRVAQIDFLLLLISAVTGFFVRMQGNEKIFDYLDFYFLLMGLSLIIRPTVLFLFGAYKAIKENYLATLIRVIAASGISSALILGILWIAKDVLKIITGLPRSVVLFDGGLSFVLILAHHIIQAKYGQLQPGEDEKDAYNAGVKTWLGNAISYFGPIVAGLILYLSFNISYAGTAMPVSGSVKRWWGTLPNTVYGRPVSTLQGVFMGLISPDMEKGPFWFFFRPISFIIGWFSNIFNRIIFFAENQLFVCIIISVIFLLIVYFLIFRERRGIKKELGSMPLLPLFVGVFMHALSYKATGYMHVRAWYWMGELMCILLFFGALFNYWLDKLSKVLGFIKLSAFITAVACVSIFVPFTYAIIRHYPLNGEVHIHYSIPAEMERFERNTEPGDVIGMTASGLSGYFIPDRKIINLDGLINSADYFEQMKEGDITQYLHDVNVKYLYGNEVVFLESDPYRWFFKGKLTRLEQGENFVFFKYDP